MAFVAGNSHAADLEEASSQFFSRANAGYYDLTTGTVQGWFKTESLPGTTGHLYGLCATTSGAGLQGFFVSIAQATNKIICGFGGTTKITSANAVSNATYTHVAFAWDTSGSELIINGVSDGTGTSATLTASAENFYLGKEPNGSSNFDGLLDDWRIYNVKRTASQVAADYNSEISTFTNVISYWKLNETSGDAADSSGNSKTLTNNGTTAYVTTLAFTDYSNALSETAGAPVETLSLVTGNTFTLSETAGTPVETFSKKFGFGNTSKGTAPTWSNVSKS